MSSRSDGVWTARLLRDVEATRGPFRRDTPWPVDHVHGRAQWVTPVHLTAVPDFELSPEGRQARWLVRDAKARARFWVMALLGALLAAVGLIAGGCSHAPPPVAPKPAGVVVLSERVGSAAADIIETATGQRPFAATLPYLPVIVFSPKDANDPGLLAHEACHVRQREDLGEARWAALYTRDFLECERMAVARGECLRSTPMEAECYLVQRQVAAGGGP